MTTYQVLSRKYRPQSFTDVVEQSAIVTTLRNALLHNRVSNAYLFCGCRGTGKTTLARLFAKAINCEARQENGDPCNGCSSCSEITNGRSLDVLEIDGASNRGIDDIRELNENAFYAPTSGRCKIYIIDEVHMLTKEAFNALLKTLEEPPPNVKFFFATTEPHKVLPTIVSRCQRFDLRRLSIPSIGSKLHRICSEQGTEIEEEALTLLARQADGSMRDAESLLDQALCSLTSPLTYHSISEMLGVASKDLFFKLDTAFADEDIAAAFFIAQEVFEGGKDIPHFVEALAEHYRTILMLKLHAPLTLTPTQKTDYERSASLYSKEHCLAILEHLSTPIHEIVKFPWKQIHLEMILLNILRSKKSIPIDTLISRLETLKETPAPSTPVPAVQIAEPPPTPALQTQEPTPQPILTPALQTLEPSPQPTPTSALQTSEPSSQPVQEAPSEHPQQPDAPQEKRSLSEYQEHERLLRFTSVELNGSVKK